MHAARKHFNDGGKRAKLIRRKFWYLWGNHPRKQQRWITAYTTSKTVNRPVRKRLHLKLFSVRTTKRRNKPYLINKKRKNFSRQTCSFLEVSYGVSDEKPTRTNMLSMKRINILYLQTILITQLDPASQYRIQISNTFTENLIFSSAKANTSLETKNSLVIYRKWF